MRVLMLGWEFPPVFSGGLGTACFGLTKGLNNQGVKVTFVMPKGPSNLKGEYVNLVVAEYLFQDENFKIKRIDTLLSPYVTSDSYTKEYVRHSRVDAGTSLLYGRDLYEEVQRYAQRVKLMAVKETFDVIHAHDWLTYEAGIIAKKASGKPLVVHIHATEFDRTGGNKLNQHVYDIERMGFHQADRIVAVSNYTKNKVVEHYGVSPEKITVVHNAVEFESYNPCKIEKKDKIVLFLGRITLQKGPEYFLFAAKKVIDKDPDIKFVFAGSGDMESRMIDMAADLGIARNVLFAGFLKGEDVYKAYQMADVYVMPSVSEPFGITPLEAMKAGTPVIISKQSGVSEVVNHVLKVDFWDIDDIAGKIISLIHYEILNKELKEHGSLEVKKFDWNIPAKKCLKVYEELMR